MTEYIEREAALKELSETVYDELASDAYNNRANYIIGALEAIPAADVEPVVRCEKCKHGNHVSGDIWKCSINGQEHSLKFFCAIGAHMDEGSDT